MFKKILFALGLGLSFGQAHSAVVWDWDATSQTLFGAQNVDVGGSLYDVEFVNGSCIDLFSGCDEASDFDFATDIQANVASQALLDQVFIDDGGSPASFDTLIFLVNGCESITIANGCVIVTPTYSPVNLGSFVIAVNGTTDFFDSTGGVGLMNNLGTDSATNPGILYAKWSPVSAIPIPAAVWLFGSALIGLVGFGRRRKSD